jgi:hypothetical protein
MIACHSLLVILMLFGFSLDYIKLKKTVLYYNFSQMHVSSSLYDGENKR